MDFNALNGFVKNLLTVYLLYISTIETSRMKIEFYTFFEKTISFWQIKDFTITMFTVVQFENNINHTIDLNVCEFWRKCYVRHSVFQHARSRVLEAYNNYVLVLVCSNPDLIFNGSSVMCVIMNVAFCLYLHKKININKSFTPSKFWTKKYIFNKKMMKQNLNAIQEC